MLETSTAWGGYRSAWGWVNGRSTRCAWIPPTGVEAAGFPASVASCYRLRAVASRQRNLKHHAHLPLGDWSCPRWVVFGLWNRLDPRSHLWSHGLRRRRRHLRFGRYHRNGNGHRHDHRIDDHDGNDLID